VRASAGLLAFGVGLIQDGPLGLLRIEMRN
jgi:hypothetical protein